MTKVQAYRALGTSSSVGRRRAELLYREKCRKFRLQMVPGMPIEVRQKAQAELATVDAAWQVIRASDPAKARKTRSSRKPTACPSAASATPPHKQQTPGPTWGPAASETSFSSPAMGLVAMAVFILIIIALVAHS